jgi:hypothetical protein
MNSAKKVTHAVFECIVAVRAAEPAGRSEIAERGRTECAARGIALRRLHCLVDALEEVRDLRLGCGHSRFHAALGSAALTEMQKANPASFHLGKLNYSIPFLADIADHPDFPRP